MDYTYTDEGLFLALTKNNRVIASRKNTDISYLNVTGQETWEKAETIDVFNGNIYLTDTQEGQIYKHKPGINGYSQKSPVLPIAIPHIQEVHIDGGFYIVSDGGKIWRIMTVK